jgi:hypothetical protein
MSSTVVKAPLNGIRASLNVRTYTGYKPGRGYIHTLSDIRTSDCSVEVVQDREAIVIGFDILIMLSLKIYSFVVVLVLVDYNA